MGDSYTAASHDGAGYVPPTADALGWEPVLEAVSGTGYVAVGAEPGAAPYQERVDEVVAAAPDVVVVQGSTNDAGLPTAEVHAAAETLYADLQAQLPEAQVVVVGPLIPPGSDPVAVAGVRTALAEAAGAAGLPFVDPLAEGWLHPSDGLFADPIHPNQTGYDAFSADLVSALRAQGH
nr:SGNH/GDSL hydrolase family protein [Modestobacter marinus]